jgi:hypothetical protein
MEQALQSRDAGVRELVEASFVESLSARTAASAERWLANDDIITRP